MGIPAQDDIPSVYYGVVLNVREVSHANRPFIGAHGDMGANPAPLADDHVAYEDPVGCT